MSKYNLDLDYIIDGVDIFPEELKEIINEAEHILNEPTADAYKQAEAHLKISQCLQKLEKFQDSYEFISCALKLRPNMPEAIVRRGIYFLEARKNFDEALNCFRQSIEHQNMYAYGFYMRGVAYFKKGDYPRALQDLTQAINIKTDFENAFNIRGTTYTAMGRYDLALQDFHQAIYLKPNFFPAYINRGCMHNFRGNYDLAICDFDKAEEFSPGFPGICLNRGNSYLYKHDYARALFEYNWAINHNPDFADAHNNRGNLYLEMGNYACALQDYTIAIHLNPTHAQAYYNKGLLYHNKKEYDKAIQEYDKAIYHNPNYIDAYNNRGNIYNDKGEHDRAIKDYDKIIAIKKDDHIAYNNRGYSYACKKDYDRAIKDYSQAITIKPDYARAYFNRGLLYEKKEKDSNALKDYLKAITLDPKYYEFDKISVSLGKIFRRLDIDFLWNYKQDDLENMPFYFCSIIAAFKKDGHTGQEYKDLIHMVYEFWKSRRYDVDGDKDGLIYQYTSLKVLDIMQEKQNLRLTPAAYMNDPEEGKVLFACMLTINGNKQSTIDVITKIRDNTTVKPIVFIRSFSESEDNLNMWNSSYGENGGGAAVGVKKSLFNENFGGEFIGLKELPSPISISTSLNSNYIMNNGKLSAQRETYQKSQSNDPLEIRTEWIGLYKILYISKDLEYKGADKKDIDDIERIKKIAVCLDKITDKQLSISIDLLAKLFIPITHIIKDISYEYEREHRLICIGQIKNIKEYINSKAGFFIETGKLLFQEGQETVVYLGPKVDNRTLLKYKHTFECAGLPSDKIKKSKIAFQ
jgi:tetratricopeptide (TPR) repeat protein